MKNRYFQFVRGILIICVVLIHVIFWSDSRCINYFNIMLRSIINFCVAIFIFISAYFVNKQKIEENVTEYIVKRSIKLIIPLLIWNIIYGIINYIEYRNIKDTCFKIIQFSTADHLYYICVLFQLVILTPITIKLMKNKKIKVMLYAITPIYLIILLICELFLKKHIQFYQYFFFGWIIYYLFGLDKNNIKKSNFLLTIIMLLISILGNSLLYCINKSNYSYACSQLNILNMAYVITLIPIVLKYNLKYKSTRFTKVFEKIGDNSYGIYFVHMLILHIISLIVDKKNINFLIYYVFVTTITIMISYFFIKALKKITRGKLGIYLGF